MYTDKKYTMIVTQEDERYRREVQLDFFVERPWEGSLSDIVFGDNIDELSQSSDEHSNEGLFYMLYANNDGKRIGSGVVDWDSIQEEIDDYEKSFQKNSNDTCDQKILNAVRNEYRENLRIRGVLVKELEKMLENFNKKDAKRTMSYSIYVALKQGIDTTRNEIERLDIECSIWDKARDICFDIMHEQCECDNDV